MTAAQIKAYTPEQLANADHLFKVLSALPEDKQRTVTMVANAFMEGMKAQERFTATTTTAARTASG